MGVLTGLYVKPVMSCQCVRRDGKLTRFTSQHKLSSVTRACFRRCAGTGAVLAMDVLDPVHSVWITPSHLTDIPPRDIKEARRERKAVPSAPHQPILVFNLEVSQGSGGFPVPGSKASPTLSKPFVMRRHSVPESHIHCPPCRWHPTHCVQLSRDVALHADDSSVPPQLPNGRVGVPTIRRRQNPCRIWYWQSPRP